MVKHNVDINIFEEGIRAIGICIISRFGSFVLGVIMAVVVWSPYLISEIEYRINGGDDDDIDPANAASIISNKLNISISQFNYIVFITDLVGYIFTAYVSNAFGMPFGLLFYALYSVILVMITFVMAVRFSSIEEKRSNDSPETTKSDD